MKTNKLMLAGAMVLCFSPLLSTAQFQKIDNLRAYDKTGINVFEDPKDTITTFDGLKIKFGAGFTQQFQNLKHKNPDALKNNIGAVGTPGNKLRNITPGFMTAQANLFLDVQLADGVRLNITSYLSSRHHNEVWIKGGYIQFDKLPFKGQIWEDLMEIATIKIGHYEIDYGDAHYRRSDGGNTLFNPFMENNIMDAFATEIGGQVMLRKNGLFGLIGMTNGMIKGNIDSLTAVANPDGDYTKSPSILLKGGFDRQLTSDIRVRVSGSYYGNQGGGSNTLFGGDRTGSNYQYVMEPNTISESTAMAFSGRFNPGFSKKINTFMLNGFLKVKGVEVFGTYEQASGRTARETDTRDAKQFSIDGVYRFGINENLFIGAKYNTVSARLANNATGTGAGPIAYTADVKIDRMAAAAGWFLTKNVMLKGEYVVQKYKDFPTADIRSGGKFNGYVVEAVVGF
ncbi:hypothetical protein [Pedobacter psychroterrae]|uniref:Phosphate-selective porin O/P n=1 Tax=Pedobacter psychroterrae TaxID=2530453 RepID=A0A4R0NN91_9SPHI|nr:hypothetical protein [Pedobacter psychroterrae]TCD01103.1 hypothetical protein EZ437_10055 [Pedobacter psychroterrae]